MRTVVIFIIGIGSFLFVVMMQGTVNKVSKADVSLDYAMAAAMHQTMTEVMEGESYGIRDRNQMIAAFLQAMVKRMDMEMDLTVRVHEVDEQLGKMDIEATGIYELPDKSKKTVSVRRKIAFDN